MHAKNFFLLLILAASSPVSASLFKHKPKSIQGERILNTDVFIQKTFSSQKKSSGDQAKNYKLNIEIQAPSVLKEKVFIKQFFDESAETPIEDIVWHSDKKSFRTNLTEVEINKTLENYSIKENASFAYDRVYAGKHIISKIFHFSRDEIFNESNKNAKNSLEIRWPGAAPLFVDIDEYIYTIKAPIPLSKLPQKKSPVQKYKKPSQRFSEDEIFKQQQLYEIELQNTKQNKP
jgi:hypothetical protein